MLELCQLIHLFNPQLTTYNYSRYLCSIVSSRTEDDKRMQCTSGGYYTAYNSDPWRSTQLSWGNLARRLQYTWNPTEVSTKVLLFLKRLQGFPLASSFLVVLGFKFCDIYVLIHNNSSSHSIRLSGSALGLGHLGHRLGPPTKGRPQIFG